MRARNEGKRNEGRECGSEVRIEMEVKTRKNLVGVTIVSYDDKKILKGK